MRRVNDDVPRVDFAAMAHRIADEFERLPAVPLPVDPAELRRQRLERSGLALPDDDLEAVLAGHLGDTLALREAKAWADRPDAFLLLTGPSGRGKTMACAWLLGERGGYSVTGPDLVRLQATAPHDRDARAKLDNLYEARTVLLDELARDDEPQKHEKTAVFGFINARQGPRGKRTLLTTNRDVHYLLKRYEDVTLHRILRQGLHVILDQEPDLRISRFRKRPPSR